MHRAFVTKEWIDDFIIDNLHALPPETVVRFFSVLRIKPDEVVAVFDGQGRQVVGILSHDKKAQKATFKQASLERYERLSPKIELIQAAIEEKKLAETIQRGCEIGVDVFTIFNAKRSDAFCFKKAKEKKIACGALRKMPAGNPVVPMFQILSLTNH